MYEASKTATNINCTLMYVYCFIARPSQSLVASHIYGICGKTKLLSSTSLLLLCDHTDKVRMSICYHILICKLVLS